MTSGMQMIGSIVEFNSACDDWNVYYERLEQFLDVNEVPEEKKSAFLISVIGADAYKSLRDLCHPVVPKDKAFEELCALLQKQFSPQVSVFRERAKFYNARHENHENVTQWYGRLKRLSVDCKFGANLEAILTDKFVTGLRRGQVLDRLCEEGETLSLEQALNIAINKECATKENAFLPASHRPPEIMRCGMQPRSAALFGAPKACFTAAMSQPLGGAEAQQPQSLFGGGGMAAKAAAIPMAMMAMDCGAEEAQAENTPEADKPAADELQLDAEQIECAPAPKVHKRRVRTRRRGKPQTTAIAEDADKQSVDE